MALPVRPPVRPTVTRRRRRGLRRAPLVTPARLLGLALMLGASLAVNWLSTADELRLGGNGVQISGAYYTDEGEVRARLGLAAGERPNVVRLRAQALAEALSDLPTIARAEVAVLLPDRLAVRIVERDAVLVWRTRADAFLLDVDGTLFSAVEPVPAELPAVEDRRVAGQAVQPGDRLDEVDLAAVLRLAAITPAMIGSRAEVLRLTVDDNDGYVISSASPPWRAVFGIYTANLRRPEANIDQQLQCLGSLLVQGEEEVEMVYLAVADDRCGTVRPRPTPAARISQNVGRRAVPAGS